MLSTVVILVLVAAMLFSLMSGLIFMLRDRGQGTRTVRALTWRISIWVVLFAFLAIAVYSGLIVPSESLRPH